MLKILQYVTILTGTFLFVFLVLSFFPDSNSVMRHTEGLETWGPVTASSSEALRVAPTEEVMEIPPPPEEVKTQPLFSSTTVRKEEAIIVQPVATTPQEEKDTYTESPSSAGDINQREVWMLTNAERQKAGMSSYAFSKKLSDIAEAKALDMIARQYFEHVSPEGVGVAELAESFGYSYLSIGENLALGNFASSGEVVLGWMNSPGHRANILKSGFTEIGIAAMRGNYQGEDVWFAVQEFGRPLSDCPPPDAFLRKKIGIFNEQLTGLEFSLQNLEIEIAKSLDDAAKHNAYVHDYNTIVTLHNTILGSIKTDVVLLNNQIGAYNACVGEE